MIIRFISPEGREYMVEAESEHAALEYMLTDLDFTWSVDVDTSPRCTNPEMHAKFAERGIEDQCGYCLADPSRFEGH